MSKILELNDLDTKYQNIINELLNKLYEEYLYTNAFGITEYDYFAHIVIENVENTIKITFVNFEKTYDVKTFNLDEELFKLFSQDNILKVFID